MRAPSDPEAPQREAEELAALQKRFASIEQPKAIGAYLDYTILSSQLKHRVRELRERSQYKDPSWYSSETAFAIISLLLPSANEATSDEVHARLGAIPAISKADRPPRGRIRSPGLGRARAQGMPRHDTLPRWGDASASALARRNVGRRGAGGGGSCNVRCCHGVLGPADPACGADYLAFIFRDVHQLNISMEEAEVRASERFAKLGEEIVASARAIDPEKSWRDLLVSLDRERPSVSDMADSYRRWHDKVMAGAGHLVTPATEYGLSFRAATRLGPACFRRHLLFVIPFAAGSSCRFRQHILGQWRRAEPVDSETDPRHPSRQYWPSYAQRTRACIAVPARAAC